MAAQLTGTSGPPWRSALAVQREGDELLAHAALAVDEHGAGERGEPADLVAQLRHRRGWSRSAPRRSGGVDAEPRVVGLAGRGASAAGAARRPGCRRAPRRSGTCRSLNGAALLVGVQRPRGGPRSRRRGSGTQTASWNPDRLSLRTSPASGGAQPDHPPLLLGELGQPAAQAAIDRASAGSTRRKSTASSRLTKPTWSAPACRRATSRRGPPGRRGVSPSDCW